MRFLNLRSIFCTIQFRIEVKKSHHCCRNIIAVMEDIICIGIDIKNSV